MKKSKMTDAEYAVAVANVAALWQKNCSLGEAKQAACTEWANAEWALKPETQAREIDRLVAEAMSQPSEATT